MDHTTAQKPEVSRRKRGGDRFFGCAFFFCLIFLISGAIPALLNIPGVQARFTGMTTTALITANAWTFDWLFFLGFSIPMILFAIACFRWLFRRLFAPSRRLPEEQIKK